MLRSPRPPQPQPHQHDHGRRQRHRHRHYCASDTSSMTTGGVSVIVIAVRELLVPHYLYLDTAVEHVAILKLGLTNFRTSTRLP